MAQAQSDDRVLATAPPKPLEEPQGTEESAALLEAFSQVPSVGRGWAFPAADGVRITLQMAQRNLPANAQRKYLTQFQLNEAVVEHGEAEVQLPVDLRDATVVAPSPSGKRMLIARPGTGDTAVILEVWDRSRVLKEVHVPSSLHGSIYNDGWFGIGAVWSSDEERLAYVAEAPVAKKTPEWGAKPSGPNGKKPEGSAPKGWRGVGEFSEDWGELNTDKRPPTIFVLETGSGEVTAVQGAPVDASVGQPQWSPDGSALLFVAWEHSSRNFPDFPQRLGIVYCFNRPCSLHAVSWPQPSHRGDAPPALRLGPASLHSAFSPRFSPDGEALVMLSQQATVDSGVHNGTPALLSMPWKPISQALLAQGNGGGGGGGGGANSTTSFASIASSLPAPRTVVAVVYSPPTPQDFPGLYSTVLPEQPFVGDGSVIVATTQWRSNSAIVVIDVGTGAVRRASPDNGASWTLVAVQQDWMLATESHPGQPFRFYACHISDSQRDSPETWSWSRVILPEAETVPTPVSEALEHMTVDILQITPTVGSPESRIDFEAVVLRRSDASGPQPTILTPHGGPHSCYSAQYFMPLTFLAASGYTIILVNYRGSTGFGERSLQSLPGNIGTNDVGDCMDALKAAIDAGYADAHRVAAVGGSHGGFLSSHLVGQHPEAFQGCILRNPVCNISLMVHLSDIPDWCFVEAWGTEEGRRRAGSGPTAEDLQRFADVSPISHVAAVTAPVLMMLGACDRRVPLDDGKRYLDALRKRADAPETRLMVFPQDTHGLDKPQTEFEQWVTALWWLDRHVKG